MKALYILILSLFLVGCTQTSPSDTNGSTDTPSTPIQQEEENNNKEESPEPSEESEGEEDTSSIENEDNSEENDSVEDIEEKMDEQREKSNALEFEGLTEEAAMKLAEENGVDFRVVQRDDDFLAVTMDYRPGRINAVIENGVVKDFSVE